MGDEVGGFDKILSGLLILSLFLLLRGGGFWRSERRATFAKWGKFWLD